MPDPSQIALYLAAALLLAVTPGRLREGSGLAMVALGLGLAFARRPAS